MKKFLITGCAGFIGSHLSDYYLKDQALVIGVDDLSRPGSEINLGWIKERHPDNFVFFKEDIRDYRKIEDIFKRYKDIEAVMHEASQVAVTTSVVDPRTDFEINALGTFNLLEACRLHATEALFIYASTNKVYGKLDQLAVTEGPRRYEYAGDDLGVNEECPLDFYSPYGCSKGAADQYVHDYHRIYGLRTVVLRQSCIYGTRQYGVEDQGWVAWFIIASLLNKPLTVFGNGKQARDILWIDDLVEAYVRCAQNPETVSGRIYNVGGGPGNVLSLLELIEYLQEEDVLTQTPRFADWRPGDQKLFVCDVAKIFQDIQWQPTVSPRQGVKRIIDWARHHQGLLQQLFAQPK